MRVDDVDKQIRHMLPSHVLSLCQILDCDDDWKTLMSVIKCSGDTDCFKYSMEHIRMVEGAGDRERRSCTGILLEEWGTSGKKLPTYSCLLACLIQARLYRAADFVHHQLLQREEELERPEDGPAARIDLPDMPSISVASSSEGLSISDCTLSSLVSVTPLTSMSPLVSATQKVSDLRDGPRKIPFKELEEGSKAFSTCLGHGSFGSVYLCHLSFEPGGGSPLHSVAVKRLGLGVELSIVSNLSPQQFHTELTTLPNFRHKNILLLVGYSCDGPQLCLVYDYMPNGSLLDKLKEEGPSLGWNVRLSVAEGAATGIHYLHTLADSPHIHRDIKSANILLDYDLTPKLGDFGLARPAPMSTMATTTIVGTTAYMSPEAFRGDITVKMDVYSFGVVLLELVTGLVAWDENRESRSLVSYLEDIENDDAIVDRRPIPQNDSIALGLLKISQDCIEEKKHLRPDMTAVLQHLSSLNQSSD